MINLTHPKTHGDKDILDLINKFKSENELLFSSWLSIEARNDNIEIGELGDIQNEVYKFLRGNCVIQDHRSLISAWMDMRSLIIKNMLGLNNNIGGIQHG